MLPTIIAAHFLSQMGEKVEKAFYSPSVYQKQSIHDTDMLVQYDNILHESCDSALHYPLSLSTININNTLHK